MGREAVKIRTMNKSLPSAFNSGGATVLNNKEIRKKLRAWEKKRNENGTNTTEPPKLGFCQYVPKKAR
ncbi:hypothetical protein LBMAG57_19890 [Verrucomicrobiota bacterium]|nr:hypothetical protein LBMAG57_19890 [Verrucomicrobiota bacterium]